MATDFQVVFPQEAIEITSVRLLPGVTPKTLEIMGKDFRSVDEVRINESTSPSVIVLSKTKLLAQVPTTLGSSTVQSVDVTSRQLTVTKKSLLRLRIGRTPSKVKGILRLLQLYLMILLKEPGTDIFSQNTGGDALKNVGRTFGRGQGGNIVSDFVLSNTIAVRQIIAIQGRDPSIPRDERLLSARVLAAHYSQRETALIVSVEINSQAGHAATANIMV